MGEKTRRTGGLAIDQIKFVRKQGKLGDSNQSNQMENKVHWRDSNQSNGKKQSKLWESNQPNHMDEKTRRTGGFAVNLSSETQWMGWIQDLNRLNQVINQAVFISIKVLSSKMDQPESRLIR